ncbi:MAG TPA: cupredoxin domain-containing protein [Acidimicrobiales bacterium]|nr:cupredoxin domain-containing protein [Acidimicrobiales bacterium]
MTSNRSWSAAAFATLAVALALVACGSDDPTLDQAGTICTPGGTTLAIAARDIAFDKDCLAAPANQELSITFDNKEVVPHNLAIRNQAGDGDLFSGEVFSGPKVVTYEVPGLAAGTYKFWCSVHPSQMQGTFLVE